MLGDAFKSLLGRPWVSARLDDTDYAFPAPDQRPVTWIGQCSLCGRMVVERGPDPRLNLMRHGVCDEVDTADPLSVSCRGTVLLHPDHEAMIAAYMLGGYEAIRGR